MQVRAAGLSGVAGQPEHVTLQDPLRLDDLRAVELEVVVGGDGAVHVAHQDGVAVAGHRRVLVGVPIVVLDEDDLAAVGRPDGAADRVSEVEPVRLMPSRRRVVPVPLRDGGPLSVVVEWEAVDGHATTFARNHREIKR